MDALEFGELVRKTASWLSRGALEQFFVDFFEPAHGSTAEDVAELARDFVDQYGRPDGDWESGTRA